MKTYESSSNEGFSILFRFAQSNRKHFYYKHRRQVTQQIVEGAASNDRALYLQESETH